jgi:integral membrane protein
MNGKITLKQFRWIALIEGVSYICFAITMPLKYFYEIPEPNYVVGMLHGVVFMLFCFWLLVLTLRKTWSWSRGVLLFIASFIPFGTFYIDIKYLRKAQ